MNNSRQAALDDGPLWKTIIIDLIGLLKQRKLVIAIYM